MTTPEPLNTTGTVPDLDRFPIWGGQRRDGGVVFGAMIRNAGVKTAPRHQLTSVRPARQVSHPDTCPTPSISAELLPAGGTLGRTLVVPITL